MLNHHHLALRSFGTRSSPCIEKEVDFTAYDLWIAGVSSESFGVIPDTNTQKQYRVLLDRTRNVFNGYDMSIKRWAMEEMDVIIESRRMLHAGASLGDGHFQNYIDDTNLKKTIPTTGYNRQEFFVEEPTNTSDDVVMGEEGTVTAKSKVMGPFFFEWCHRAEFEYGLAVCAGFSSHKKIVF